MKTYALLFSIDAYEREELAKLSQEELYYLAFVTSTFCPEEAEALTLDEFSFQINEDKINLDNSWLYFATV